MGIVLYEDDDEFDDDDEQELKEDKYTQFFPKGSLNNKKID
jgi:hypothetical protein